MEETTLQLKFPPEIVVFPKGYVTISGSSVWLTKHNVNHRAISHTIVLYSCP